MQVSLSRFDKRAFQKIKLKLLRETSADLLAGRRAVSAFIDLIDIVCSKPVTSVNKVTFADLANFYLRFKNSDYDLPIALRDLQVVVFGEVKLPMPYLLEIQSSVNGRCRATNLALRMTMMNGVLSSGSGPNPRREFIAEVSALLTNRQLVANP